MKTIIATLLSMICIPLLLQAAPVTYFGWDSNTLPPAGPGSDNPSRLTQHPNADLAASRFLSRLVGVATETFESFTPQSAPATLSFGSDTASLSGSPVVYNVTTNTYAGTFPVSGDQFLLLLANSSSFFKVDFSSPQAAFGFFATDVEVAQLQLTLVKTNGQRIALTVPTPSGEQPSGSVFFFGVIDTDSPFRTVEFARLGSSLDGFGFDSLSVGRLEQVHPEPAALRISRAGDLHVGLEITGTIGATYRLEYSVSLPSNAWTTLANIVLPSSPYSISDTNSPAVHGQRFYRAVAVE